MLCYAACPQFGENPDFIGPEYWRCCSATMATRARQLRKAAWSSSIPENGVWSCTAVGYCSEVCPKHVDPANAVNQNKTNSALDFFLRVLGRPAHSKSRLSGGVPDERTRAYRRPLNPRGGRTLLISLTRCGS